METTAIPGLRACPSCGAMNATRFCGDCGRPLAAVPQRTAAVLKEGASELLGVDAGLPRTLRDLVLRPLKVARAVRAGNEEGYVRPFRLYFLLASAYILLLTTVQPHTFELASHATPDQMAKMVRVAGEHGISREMMDARFGQRMNMVLPLISAILLIPMALLLRRMDRTRPVGDHVLTMASVTNSMWGMCIVLMPVAFLGKWPFVAAAQAVGVACIAGMIIRLYPGRTHLRTGMRVAAFLVADYVMTLLLSMIILLGVMFSVLRF